MYATRPLSHYKSSPNAIFLPPEGPNSGYLVLQDDDSMPTYCFGLCKNRAIDDLPFPQNKLIVVDYHVHQPDNHDYHTYDSVYLIPVINQPLSSNCYYVIKADGQHQGEAYASSKEEDKVTCCFFCECIIDVKPRPLDPDDIYQEFEFSITNTFLNSKILAAHSVAPDGHPPHFLRRRGWKMSGKTPKNFTLGEAQGLDHTLRARLPDFSFPSSEECSKPVVVGKWYIPFMFIKQGTEKDRIKRSVFYEMTLEQRWERIFAKEDYYSQTKTVAIDVVIPTKVVTIAGKEAAQTEMNEDQGVVWFRTSMDDKGDEEQVGLSTVVVERMMWEQERAGWVEGKDDKKVRVVKDEEYGGIIGWTRFGCYVLVEGFVLKRNDGSLVLNCDFRHTHQLRSKWE